MKRALVAPLTPALCLDRAHGLQTFGDMVYTWVRWWFPLYLRFCAGRSERSERRSAQGRGKPSKRSLVNRFVAVRFHLERDRKIEVDSRPLAGRAFNAKRAVVVADDAMRDA